MKQLWSAVHVCDGGESHYVFRADEMPTVEEFVEAFDIDFEPENEEWITIEPMAEPPDFAEVLAKARVENGGPT